MIVKVIFMDETVYLYTDGACSGNPGPGGYASILVYKGFEKVICGGSPHTTNNRMELSAVIEGLKALNRKSDVLVTSDSSYVCNAVNMDWLKNWKKNNYKRKGQDIPNVDLWKEFDSLIQNHNVTFNWIKGHDGHEYNERCDKIAVAEAEKHKNS